MHRFESSPRDKKRDEGPGRRIDRHALSLTEEARPAAKLFERTTP